jgi:hypothetical protein
MKTNWYEDFFRGLALSFWRNAVSAEMTASECGFIQTELGVAPGPDCWTSPAATGDIALNWQKGAMQ